MNCSGCFKEVAVEGYCKKCLKELFDGEKVSHILPFHSPYTEDSELFNDLTKKMSISGVQVKYSMKLEKTQLVLTDTGGQFLLKPIPIGQFKNMDQAPANEHLTMQLARQLFRIAVPPNAMIYFRDRTPAYLVKRFDVKQDGSKFQQEDFAQIAQVTEITHGRNFKYDLSYEEIGALMKIHVSLYPVEIEKFFRLILFNYIFSNGDAHVKNFSVIQIETGDYVLTPAYDLLCTRIHSPSESDMALMLLKDRFSDAYDAQGFYTYNDFLQFGKVLGIKESRIIKIISEFNQKEEKIDFLIDSSYLNERIKDEYKSYYKDKIKRINMEWPRRS
ncbi:type II toxin-antitoxin system HipA family toxin [Dyadobacter subterraneus]|uniref:HipA domain-containing protein n=1 Tax=Dyadobacter subterraneus TaxID=2773304 RepID=A0ABR9WCA6_9BACT|nr:HipA domain-containing protein [Dyadobacter subterraneus]MBE9462006.1 HipA domain-containing protein [Dyadobacter subterraneus]